MQDGSQIGKIIEEVLDKDNEGSNEQTGQGEGIEE